MTITIHHDELIAAAGGFDAIKRELDDQHVEMLLMSGADSGSGPLNNALACFRDNWSPGMVVVTGEQGSFASGLRATVSDFLGVDADVAYAHAVLARGLDLE